MRRRSLTIDFMDDARKYRDLRVASFTHHDEFPESRHCEGVGFGWNAIVRLACGRDVERNRKKQSAAKNFENAAIWEPASGAKLRVLRGSR
jgi:hypothetical protein